MTRLLSRLRSRGPAPERPSWNGNGHIRRLAATPRATTTRPGYAVSAAESAPCTCPDFCERDHEHD